VFSFATIRSNNICAAILILMAILNEVQWVWMETSSKTSPNVSSWNIANRNFFAFYEGWLLVASNLSLGSFLVFSLGMRKETQAYFFWITCSLCVAGLAAYNLTRPKGFVNNIGFYISALYALVGALISTIRKFGKAEEDWNSTDKEI
jgi:hypothetical protein